MWYTNRNNLVNGELTMGKSKKFNTTFTQKQLLTAKYSVVDGDYIVEPAYNFVRVCAGKEFFFGGGRDGAALCAAGLESLPPPALRPAPPRMPPRWL